jgi:hypothetical protein
MALVFHNAALEARCVEGGYRSEQVESVARALHDHRVLDFEPLATGLYPA